VRRIASGRSSDRPELTLIVNLIRLQDDLVRRRHRPDQRVQHPVLP